MGKKIDDMVGRRFGRWTVVEETKERDTTGCVKYLCECDCGNKKTVSGMSLRRGDSQSCGCYNMDILTKFGHAFKYEKLYAVWLNMKDRCRNPNSKYYKNYGGRGITVCDEWKTNYESFKSWSSESGYRDGLWIDRIDNSKGYSPDNCRWVTPKTQQRNKRTNVLVECNGEMVCIMEAAERSSIPYATLERRVKLGWPKEKLFIPVDKSRSHPEEIKRGMAKKREPLPFEDVSFEE